MKWGRVQYGWGRVGSRGVKGRCLVLVIDSRKGVGGGRMDGCLCWGDWLSDAYEANEDGKRRDRRD